MGRKIKIENTVKYSAEFEEGYGVTFYPFDNAHVNENDDLIEDETIIDIEPILVEINEETVNMVGSTMYVEIEDVTLEGVKIDFAVSGFKKHSPLWESDTHDLRSYFFETKGEAEEHIKNTVKRFKNRQAWENFVKHDYFKYV